jgi:ABC-type phosphate transport system substrate-binding protein
VISKKLVAICAAFGVAVTGAAIAVPAVAEPVSNSYAIVGSDTLEDVVNGIVNGSNLTGANVRSQIGGKTLGSFDATGTPCIITKPFGIRFGRPNGSSDGVKALSRSIDGASYTSGTTACPDNGSRTITDQVDIARSSSGGTTNAAGELIYYPFGRDAIAYAYHSGSNAAGITTLSAAQMKSFFECTVRTLDGKTITPVIPQDGSGTRKDFLTKINSTETLMKTVSESGGCVVEAQEHDGNSLTVANAIMPMSVSRWVAMNTGATVSKIGSALVAGLSDVPAAPVTGSGATMAPNQAYYNDTTWGRDTYLVVEYAKVDSNNVKYDPFLASILDPTRSTSLTNVQTTTLSRVGTLKRKYGFLAPNSTTTFRVAKTA